MSYIIECLIPSEKIILGAPTCTVWYCYGEIIIATEKCISDKRMYYVAWNILGLKTLL